MNNKIVVGLIFGAVLGAVDGATAWFTPEARPQMASILMGSSFKGMLVGLLSGWFARKVQSTKWGIVLGAALGLLFAFLVAHSRPNAAPRTMPHLVDCPGCGVRPAVRVSGRAHATTQWTSLLSRN